MGSGASKQETKYNNNNENENDSAANTPNDFPHPTQQQQSQQLRRSKASPIAPPPVSSASFEVFMRALQRLPFTLTEDQFETIIYDLAECEFPPRDVLLKAGEGFKTFRRTMSSA